MLRSWKTLFLPRTLPRSQDPWHYTFGHNKTHMALSLDYASLVNHHEHFNAGAPPGGIGPTGIYFQVRRGFQFAIAMFQKYAACIHAYIHKYKHKFIRVCIMHYVLCMCTHHIHVHIKLFEGHERHRGWTGNFYSVWQREGV